MIRILTTAVALLVMISPAFGQSGGDLAHQERGDVVFRALQAGVNSHSGVYNDFVFGALGQPANPADYNLHTLVEMVGITGISLTGTVTGTRGIAVNSLQNFRSASTYYAGPSRISTRR